MHPTIVWFRRDLRLEDHAALTAACAKGGPVIPVFICDDLVETLGAAPKWRLGQGVGVFNQQLRGKGSRLILRRGNALDVLKTLIKETGAKAIYWSRAYDPASQARDTKVKAALTDDGVEAKSFKGHLLFEPWNVATKTGGFYRVYTPMWKAVWGLDVDGLLAPPDDLAAPETWPDGDNLEDWKMGAAMQRGGGVVAGYAQVGATKALERLAYFIDNLATNYKEKRDLPGVDATSHLAQNLALGEISPHRCWHMAWPLAMSGDRGAETFMKEVVWREFAYHLVHHTPQILTDNWKSDWDKFPWATDGNDPKFLAWCQGRTGVEFVDAGMRELYTTGTMHNRARMIVASYLTKHLMTHWQLGLKWFEDCLIDWDPASNAMGWQWAAGSGPDASPYFRVFNPDTQAEKFDADRAYRAAWIGEGQGAPPQTALDYYEAIPKSWGLGPNMTYPTPIVDLKSGREAALEAYKNRDF